MISVLGGENFLFLTHKPKLLRIPLLPYKIPDVRKIHMLAQFRKSVMYLGTVTIFEE